MNASAKATANTIASIRANPLDSVGVRVGRTTRRDGLQTLSRANLLSLLFALMILTCLVIVRPVAAQDQDPCAGDAALSSPECAPEVKRPSLRITQAFGAVVIIWNDFAGNDYGYELFRDGLPYHSAAAGETSFVDRLAIDGQNYSYAVRPMVVEPELAGRATIGKTAYIQNSAWSNLDPGDAVRTADAQTIVNELKNIDASDRDTFLAAITGDSTLAVEPASEDEAGTESSDANPDADAKAEPAGIATYSLMETVLDAETDDDRDSATTLINEFLEQQGSNRRLYSVFGLTEYNPNSNQQHRLIAETFNEIRSSLLSLDYNQLGSSSVDSSITQIIVGLLDDARARGLKLTQTRGKASEAQNNATAGQSDDPVAPAATALLQPVLPDNAGDNYQSDTDAANADEVVRVQREAPAESAAQTPAETETPAAAQAQALQPTLTNGDQQTVTDADAAGTENPDLLQPTVARTLELDQGVPQQQLNTDSAGREILDLNVQPGQGFETLSLDQPIPSGDGDLIDLDPSTNNVKLETLPVQ